MKNTLILNFIYNSLISLLLQGERLTSFIFKNFARKDSNKHLRLSYIFVNIALQSLTVTTDIAMTLFELKTSLGEHCLAKQ